MVGRLKYGGRTCPQCHTTKSATQRAAQGRRETKVPELGMHIMRPGHGSHLVTPGIPPRHRITTTRTALIRSLHYAFKLRHRKLRASDTTDRTPSRRPNFPEA